MAKLGYIGLGNMGKPMSNRLLDAGKDLTVWNRTASKADELVAKGAKLAATPKEIGENCDIIFICVSDGPTLKSVTQGEDGVVAGLTAGKIVINMSTVAPAESEELNAAVEGAGCKLIRGPVTGSTMLAQNGTLGILASGDKDTYDIVLPYFEILGKNQFYLGDAEQAVVLKLAINTMIASTMQIEAEAVVLSEKAGLDVAQVCEVIAGSAAGSPLCGYKAKLIAEGEYAPAFTVKLRPLPPASEEPSNARISAFSSDALSVLPQYTFGWNAIATVLDTDASLSSVTVRTIFVFAFTVFPVYDFFRMLLSRFSAASLANWIFWVLGSLFKVHVTSDAVTVAPISLLLFVAVRLLIAILVYARSSIFCLYSSVKSLADNPFPSSFLTYLASFFCTRCASPS